MTTPALTVRWMWAFVDVLREWERVAVDFWTEATRTGLSARRGDRDQFATFLPTEGDPWLKLQVVGEGGGTHLDLDVDDPAAAAEVATAHGAVLDTAYDDVLVMRSPGGFPFCLTAWGHSGRASTQVRGGASLVDQACLDIPAERYADEVAFWSSLTGWEARRSGAREEFHYLVRSRSCPVRILLQRLGQAEGTVAGHLDVACADRRAEVVRHVGLGAAVVAEEEFWTVMRDPAGLTYCLTDRDPETGRLG